ncbi:hypothetical protein HDV01_001883 [Terramyces sp. JEL0728]|nr:hypothetical protein HDV01_001883 [Terramyces sp. JEL0728]
MRVLQPKPVNIPQKKSRKAPLKKQKKLETPVKKDIQETPKKLKLKEKEPTEIAEYDDPWGILQATRETKEKSHINSVLIPEEPTSAPVKTNSDSEESETEVTTDVRTDSQSTSPDSSPIDNSVFNIMKRVQANVEQIQQKHKRRRK